MTLFHGMNVVRCKVVTGKRNPLIGEYLPPSTLDHLPDLEESLTHFWGQEPVMLGGLGVYI